MKRFAASAEGKVYITCAAQSWSGLFIGAGLRPRLPSDAVPARIFFFSARIVADHAVEPVELDVEHRAHQLRRPRAVAGERLLLLVAAAPVEVAGVDGAARPLGEPVVIDRDAAAFARRSCSCSS